MNRLSVVGIGLSVLFVMFHAPALAVVIDNFTTPQPIQSAPEARQVIGSVSGDGIVGGTRIYRFGPDATGAVNGSLSFGVTGGLGSLAADAAGRGQLRLDYDGTTEAIDTTTKLVVDLTDDGASDRFIIDVAEVNGGTVNFLVNVGPGGGNITPFLQFGGGLFNPTGSPGLFEIPFSDFVVITDGVGAPPSLTEASQIAVFWQVGDGVNVSVGEFCTGNADGCVRSSAPSIVPLPPAGLLLLAGIALPGLWRRSFSSG